jgi:lysophospholipase L1-like esterase
VASGQDTYWDYWRRLGGGGDVSTRQEARPTTGVARQVGAVAAYAGGALTAAGALSVGVLLGELLLARLTIPGAESPPPRCAGEYPPRGTTTSTVPPEPIRLAVIGDSTAAGYGVLTRAETPGALLATWIADTAGRPVRVTCPAVVGSPSAWLPAQVDTALAAGVDLAVIFIGANDVTTAVSEQVSVRYLAEAVETLREAGAEVVVATCPDLGTIRPIMPPLRWLARRWSRQLATAQAVAVARLGGRAVSLGDLLGPTFDAAPDRMFGADRFHPSAEGYRAAAEVVLPSALAALGLSPEHRTTPATGLPEGGLRIGEISLGQLASGERAVVRLFGRGRDAVRARRTPSGRSVAVRVNDGLSLSDAAASAADNPGTEVTADGPFGRLRRAIRHRAPTDARSTATHRRDLPVTSLSGDRTESPAR